MGKKSNKAHNGTVGRVLNCMLDSDWMTVNDIRSKSKAVSNHSVHSAFSNIKKKGYIIDSKPSGEFVSLGGARIESKLYRITGLVEPKKAITAEKTSYAWNFNTLSEVPATVIVAGRKCRISLSFEE